MIMNENPVFLHVVCRFEYDIARESFKAGHIAAKVDRMEHQTYADTIMYSKTDHRRDHNFFHRDHNIRYQRRY